MLDAIIAWSGTNRKLVLLAGLLLALAGVWAARNSPLDAIPDLSDPQVIVFSEWMGRSPELVDDQVTYPLVTGLQSLPGVRTVRGFTMFGMSFTYVLLEEGVDPYWARTRVLERIQQLGPRLPPDVEISLGPDASAVGWVYQYALVDRTNTRSIADLTALQDWTLRFELETVAGVSEVATVGGLERQVQVVLDPERLRAAGLTTQQVASAVARSNRETGGRVLESAGRELYVQGRGYVTELPDLDRAAVGLGPDGLPIPLEAVASVEWGPDIRRGIAELDGRGEVVGGLVVARQGENALDVIRRVKDRLETIPLPEGVEVVTVYDRSTVINHSVVTLFEALFEELVIVAIVVAVFLLHFRSMLIPMLVLPMAIAASFLPLWALGLTINIMSLAGIIFAVGDMVDAMLLMVENAARRIEEQPEADRTRVVIDACRELGAPITGALLLIAVSFLPIFALQAQEGRLFAPLAFTNTFTMLSAALFTLTVTPALAVILLRGRIPSEERNPVNRLVKAVYRPMVRQATSWPRLTVALALLAAVVTVPVYQSLGREFMPPLYEESLLFMPVTIPGISSEQARSLLIAQDRILAGFPEVERVFGKAGRADTATDPAPLSMIETTITLRPLAEWRAGMTPERLVEEMAEALHLPGVNNAFTMPIRGRIDMLTTGIRTPVGVKVLGTDLHAIDDAAQRIEMALRDVRGTRSVYAERQLAAVRVDVVPRREDLLLHGAVVDDVLDVVDLGLGGMPLGRIFDGRERYSLIARYGRDFRSDEDALRRLPVSTLLGVVPLENLADVRRTPGAAMLVNEEGLLAAYVYVDPGDRDLGGYVDEARQVVDALGLPPELRIRWTGQYEFLERAQARMNVLVPVTLAIVFFLTWLIFRSVAETALVLATLPFAAIGSFWFLWLAGYNLSIAVWVAIIALLGVGAETGTVLATYLDLGLQRALERGEQLTPERIVTIASEAASDRIRGLVLALLTNILGLLPILLSTGVGSDLARRMAGPMFGGLLTLSVLTALVLPALWVLWRQHQVRRGVFGPLPAMPEGAP